MPGPIEFLEFDLVMFELGRRSPWQRKTEPTGP